MQVKGAADGTGIAFYDNAIYAEEKDKIVRYALKPGEFAPSAKPDADLSGMPLTGDHPMHPFVIDAKGGLLSIPGRPPIPASRATACPSRPVFSLAPNSRRAPGPGATTPNRAGQAFSPAERFPTGIRNGEGFAFDAEGRLFVTQHGCDQLSQNWPKLYTVEQGADLPAEEVLQILSAPISVGRNAITTRSSIGSCSRRNMAATAARRPAFATVSRLPSPCFPAIGRRMTS